MKVARLDLDDVFRVGAGAERRVVAVADALFLARIAAIG